MNRSDLIEAISADNPELSKQEAKLLVFAFFEAITGHLADGGRVELRDFGTFSTRDRESRLGHNPRTGVPVDVSEKRVPHFKPGKALRKRIAGSKS